jgi:hypothetical protein
MKLEFHPAVRQDFIGPESFRDAIDVGKIVTTAEEGTRTEAAVGTE